MSVTLDTAVALLPDTQYGFQITSDGTGGNDGFFIEIDGTASDSCTGGFALGTGTIDGLPDPGLVFDGAEGRPSDRAFVASMTAVVPEPASFAAMAALGAGFLLRRRSSQI